MIKVYRLFYFSKDSSEESNLLHPTSAYSNLPDIIEGKLPKYSVSSEEVGHVEPDSAHGYMLHRRVLWFLAYLCMRWSA